MNVVSLPKKNLDTHRLRTAIRTLQINLDEQTDTVKDFRTAMAKLDIRIKNIGRSVRTFDINLGTVKKDCFNVRKQMPDALALKAG